MKRKIKIPGYALAAAAIATAVVAAGFIAQELGFDRTAPAHGHCYGKGC